MDKSIAQYLGDIKGLVNSYSDDLRPANRAIYNYIKSNRSTILSRQNNKGNLFNSSEYQTITTFPMEMVNLSQTCGVNLDGNISKSVFKVPKTINFNTGKPVLKIYTLDSGRIINIESKDKIINSLDKKYQFPVPDAFIQNEYLFIPKDIGAVVLSGIYESPEEVYFLNVCYEYDSCGNITNELCRTPMLEVPFSISDDTWTVVREMTRIDVLKAFGVYQDRENNAKNDNQVIQPPVKNR